MDDKVKAGNFYQDGGDKIKLNWFCYEYANNIYDFIKSSKKLAQYRTHNSPAQIADFSLYFAKRMRKSLYDMQTGKKDSIEINAQYVYEYNPKCSFQQAQALIEAAQSAWNDMISGCSVCSSQCLSEAFELTPMFDNLAKTGWPS
jgi:Pyruvate/2-oxoacid:ferredoxin oxidoreductase delta subunit